MKELTIEEKAKAYDEAYKKVAVRFGSNVADEIFLKESEDERMRKKLLEHCRKQAEMYNTLLTAKEYSELQSWIAWLEKQGNLMKALQISNAEIGELVEKNYYLKEQLEKQGNNMGISEATKKKLEDNLNKALEKETPESCNEFLDKQCEQKPIFEMKTPEESLGIDSETYSKIVDECIYGEQKPIKEHNACEFCEDRYGCVNPCSMKLIEKEKFTNKVEPKFKIEEEKWYVCTQTFVLRGKIVVIKGQTYQAEKDNVIKGEDGCLFIDRHDGKASEYFRCWTIQEAKDGDVLFYDDGWTCIFKHIHGIWYSSYCFITNDGEFHTSYERHAVDAKINGNVHPATKKQRDLLFQKMKEEGYEWDAQRKELKKIEQKPAWSEEDESMLNQTLFYLGAYKNGCSGLPVLYMNKCISWLKSLRPQSTWKPSDEQMDALHYVTNFDYGGHKATLVSLYEQLKKLRGE